MANPNRFFHNAGFADELAFVMRCRTLNRHANLIAGIPSENRTVVDQYRFGTQPCRRDRGTTARGPRACNNNIIRSQIRNGLARTD